ncbi:hypothetical protein [Aureimonas populi]|uniref:Uncharacterized protein n=1 Tax=Aureimonas populi TaxID=1701758 RepID=A0ABW5CM28_9HYPH|nr:hypothetical protein [Aureimonas populi]
MTTATAALESCREATSLRRYVRRRAAGRGAPEWSTYDTALGAWVVADGEAAATSSGRPWRRVRQESEPWCGTLGRDLTIACDDDLQALFATLDEDDPGAWRTLWLEADRQPARCLADWRSRGRRLLSAIDGASMIDGGTLAAKFAARGGGKRSLTTV